MTSQYRIPAPLQNTIDNLSYLANTEEGEKLFFKEKTHIKDSEWSARLRRYLLNENLESQKKIMKEIVDLGLDSLKTYKENVHYPRLIKEFYKAKDGLCNLRNTYLKQGKEISDLDTLIYVMENQINGISKEDKIKAGLIVIPPDYHADSEKNEINLMNDTTGFLHQQQQRREGAYGYDNGDN